MRHVYKMCFVYSIQLLKALLHRVFHAWGVCCKKSCHASHLWGFISTGGKRYVQSPFSAAVCSECLMDMSEFCLLVFSSGNVLFGPNGLLISPHGRTYASVNWVSFGSDNGLSPARRPAIIWTNPYRLLIRPQGNISMKLYCSLEPPETIPSQVWDRLEKSKFLA